MVQNVVFMSGALRSGSTLLKLILDNHSHISNPGEFDFLFDQIGDDGTLPDITAYKSWLENHRIFVSKQLTIDPKLDYAELVQDFVKQKEIADCTLLINVHRGFHKIIPLFPNARYIHLLRDPRDVGLSSINMGWSGNAYYGIDHWIDTENSWNKLRPQLKEDQFIEVKYEDLVSSSQEVLEKICTFLDLDMEQKMFDFFKTSSYGEINQDSLYRWKKELSSSENGAIEHKIPDLLSEKGYDVNLQTSPKPNAFTLAALTLDNKLSKWKFSLDRYGPRLFLMNKIGNYLPLGDLRKSIRLERSEIDKKFLK